MTVQSASHLLSTLHGHVIAAPSGDLHEHQAEVMKMCYDSLFDAASALTKMKEEHSLKELPATAYKLGQAFRLAMESHKQTYLQLQKERKRTVLSEPMR